LPLAQWSQKMFLPIQLWAVFLQNTLKTFKSISHEICHHGLMLFHLHPAFCLLH
jgi:hypothetical protein